jgi:hypothetical protein
MYLLTTMYIVHNFLRTVIQRDGWIDLIMLQLQDR